MTEPPRRRSRTRPLLGIAIAATALLTACSGGDDSDTNDEPGPAATASIEGKDTKAAGTDLDAAAESYVNMIFSGNAADAYDTLSARCQEAVGGSRDAYATAMEDASLYGTLKAGNIKTADDGTTGRASYTVGDVDDLTRTRQQWILENGAWRWDACPSTATGEPSPVSEDVTITRAGTENHQTWGPDAYVVHYEITNHGTDDASYFVQLAFLDKDGDQLGTTGITADNLGPGKTKTGDTAPVDAEIENGPMDAITAVQVTQVNLS